jgi:metal-sulfur cluster biosynthetic enzyme
MNIFDLDEKALAPDSPENSDSYADLDLPGTVGGNQFSIEQGLVLQTLRGILDPELGINVVDLGLVYELRVTEKDIYIKMTMTTPGCPMHGSIIEAVERAIELYFPQKKTIVDLVWEPQWTPERLSAEANEMLGMS